MNFVDDLNAAVHTACTMPRVRFETGLGDVPERWIAKKHANGAVHEPGTIAAFLAVANKWRTDRVFDCGALWGYFSLLSLMVCDKDADVTAFEAHPGVIGPLTRNLVPSVRVVNAVLTDRCERDVRFWINGFNLFEEPEGGWDNLPSIPGALKPRGGGNTGGFASVDFITLDDYCRQNRAPDLIKIDVEGYQAKAVLGGVDTFCYRRPIVIIELHDPEKLARFGTTNKATVEPLFDLGYTGFWCGNFRDPDATFEALDALDERHEKLSIMVLVPGERL